MMASIGPVGRAMARPWSCRGRGRRRPARVAGDVVIVTAKAPTFAPGSHPSPWPAPGRTSATGRCASAWESASFRSSLTSCPGEGPTTASRSPTTRRRPRPSWPLLPAHDGLSAGDPHRPRPAGMSAVSIEVSHLTKVFGGRTAVSDVSFSVAGGEVFGFLGPNGAGKTRTVRILATLISPTAGSAVLPASRWPGCSTASASSPRPGPAAASPHRPRRKTSGPQPK
jgi:hypothetical protein